MTGDNVRFTLSNDTKVTVKKVLNNKYDFELTMPNGSRKTFIWTAEADLRDRKGKVDKCVTEAIKLFTAML